MTSSEEKEIKVKAISPGKGQKAEIDTKVYLQSHIHLVGFDI